MQQTMKLEISVQFRGFLNTCILIMQNSATLGALELEIAPWNSWRVQSYTLSQLIDIVWNALIIIVCYTLRSQWWCLCGGTEVHCLCHVWHLLAFMAFMVANLYLVSLTSSLSLSLVLSLSRSLPFYHHHLTEIECAYKINRKYILIVKLLLPEV